MTDTKRSAGAAPLDAGLHPTQRAPKDYMKIVCCGCGTQVDLPTVSELVQAETTPQVIVYRAPCPSCGFAHRILVLAEPSGDAVHSGLPAHEHPSVGRRKPSDFEELREAAEKVIASVERRGYSTERNARSRLKAVLARLAEGTDR